MQLATNELCCYGKSDTVVDVYTIEMKYAIEMKTVDL